MEERLAKVESTFLGIEDHGILTAMLHVTYGGSSQGIGGFAFDHRPRGSDRVVGSAFGVEWIRRVLEVLAVDSWEMVKGSQLLVLFPENTQWNAQPLGIKALPWVDTEPFLFAELAERHAGGGA